MIKKLTKHGNSYAIVINKPIMELLGIDASTPLEMKIENGGVFLYPVSTRRSAKEHRKISKDKKLQNIYEQTIAYYDAALKKMAKN